MLIVEAALAVLDSIYVPGALFKRAGVWLDEIAPDVATVPSLFDEQTADDERTRRFMGAIDKINSKVGKPNIGLASRIVKGHRGHNDGYSSSFQAPSRKK